MTLQLGKIHEYSKVNDGGPPVLTRVDPVTRISYREPDVDAIYVFIQHGAFYTEDGKVIKEANIPHWLEGQINKMTQAAREECGLKDWVDVKTYFIKKKGQEVPVEEDDD